MVRNMHKLGQERGKNAFKIAIFSHRKKRLVCSVFKSIDLLLKYTCNFYWSSVY